MSFHRLFSLLLFVGAGMFLPSEAYSEIESWKVVDVGGASDVLAPSEKDWKPLAIHRLIQDGSQVRTGKKGSVDLVLNRGWESVIRLNPGSQVTFVSLSPHRLRLEKGSLYALLEAPEDRLQVASPQGMVRMGQGGLSLEASPEGERIRAFGDQIQIGENTLEEGMQWTLAARTDPVVSRMNFSDYEDWQRWVKKNYARKDKYFLKRH